jgi:hypothetical protein
MTKVKCDLKDCDNNQNGICQSEEITLDNGMNTFECFDYENKERYEKLRKILLSKEY